MVVAFCGLRAEKTREALEKYNLVSRRARMAVQRYNRATGTKFTTLRELADHGAERGGDDWLDVLDRARPGEPGLGDRVRQFTLEDRATFPGQWKRCTAMTCLHSGSSSPRPTGLPAVFSGTLHRRSMPCSALRSAWAPQGHRDSEQALAEASSRWCRHHRRRIS